MPPKGLSMPRSKRAILSNWKYEKENRKEKKGRGVSLQSEETNTRTKNTFFKINKIKKTPLKYALSDRNLIYDQNSALPPRGKRITEKKKDEIK